MELKNIKYSKHIFFDGAMGTMLQERGLNTGDKPDMYNMTQPETIKEIHKIYIDAGADIIITNTFGANAIKFKGAQYSVTEVVKAGVEIAKAAVKESKKEEKYVALDIGPLGELLEPLGSLSFEEAYECFAEMVKAGASAGADLILIETMSDLYEVRAAVLAAKENSTLPVFVTMTYQNNGRTLTGTDPISMVNVLEALGVDALGVNCSLGPKDLMPIVKEILKYAHMPVIVQPNAGLPSLHCGKTVFNVDTDEFVSQIEEMADLGALIFGGCCGTNPSYIKGLVSALKDKTPFEKKIKAFTAVSSYGKTVVLGSKSKIIGERINPTGKKLLKEAIKNDDIDYIVGEAINQSEKGASILDINMGVPGIDEKSVMVKVVKEVQSSVLLPLQLDSSNGKVLEAAARVYNGKPIINSVNGKAEVMKEIFPIVKKYGACVIGLTLDEKGIPNSAEGRYLIAEKIVNTAAEYGVGKENIIIDCLVLTASAQQAEVIETIKAVRMVKEGLGVKTALGVSNVSFGLPGRALLNRTFLAMALGSGLDAAILNPMDEEMIATFDAFNVLSNSDKEAEVFIQKYGNTQDDEIIEHKTLREVILSGTKEEAAHLTRELLKRKTSMEIVDEYFIPAMDIAGKRYEKGDIFLPQLLKTAEIVKASFEVIKANETGEVSKISKGKILIATVKGDIHDIGKNIVKVLLENYGFDVYDLGKDVAPDLILEEARKNHIKLIGLSALMTTTVTNMEETIKILKKSDKSIKVMVGGAVLTESYAEEIGADYYAKDAGEAVKIARGYYKV